MYKVLVKASQGGQVLVKASQRGPSTSTFGLKSPLGEWVWHTHSAYSLMNNRKIITCYDVGEGESENESESKSKSKSLG